MRRFLPSMLLLAAVALGVTLVAAGPVESLVRLTPMQYQNTIHEIFGANIQVPSNSVDPGFRDRGLLALGTRKLALSAAELERYELLAQRIAAEVVIDPRNRATLVPCKPKSETAPDNDCVRQFVTRVGPLLFRRPLTDSETSSYVATASAATGTLKNFYAGLKTALAKMLVSPEFLFRIERTEPDPSDPAKLRLDAYSRATRLSFFLWDSSPDSELLAAAQSGKLLSTAGLSQQVERLLASPRMEEGVRAFFSDMFAFDAFATLSIDSNLFPRFTKNVEDDAREQTLRTIVDHLLNKNADYRDLMVTRDTFLTPSLAAIYGVPLARPQHEMGGAIPWIRYQFPEGDPHVGLLTQVSFLSLHSHPGSSSPTLRGKALRENFMCQPIQPPPANVDFSILSDTETYKTARDRMTQHRRNPTCAGCHRLMDPMGLALENFDAAGVYRTTENGVPIDASGDLNNQKFSTPAQLEAVLRDTPQITSCVVNRAYSYGNQRVPTAAERTWLTALETELTQDGVKWRALMRRIALNPDFYTNPAPEPQTEQ
jgi:hypothetical protein